MEVKTKSGTKGSRKKKEPEDEVNFTHSGDFSFGVSSVGVYAFETVRGSTFGSPSILPFYNHSRILMPTYINGFKIIPYGHQNDYPDTLRTILDEDNFLPQGLTKNAQLIWGQGPALYRIRFEGGKRIKEFVDDPKISAWLQSWDYWDYLLKSTIDYTTINGHFTKFYRNRGARIGAQAKIAKLEHESSTFARLEWPDQNWEINNIIVGDFRQPWQYGLTSYPIFDPTNVFAYPVAMRYSNLYNFSLDYEYSRAPFHGATNWIKLASSIPKLLINFNENAAAIKYHVKSPAVYWMQKQELLERNCALQGIEYNQKMLDKVKDDTFAVIAKALSGVENAGKMVTTETIFDELGNDYVGWEIIVLDQKVSEFITAQLDIAREASFQNSATVGLHPSLSNLSKDGNLPSGSEQLYAFKLFLMTAIDIPEGIICKDINIAIKANFPDTDLRIGFYHDAVLTEQATNPNDRVKNQPMAGN